jgi:hypothetical protein
MMMTVEFNCEFMPNGDARVSARMGSLEEYEYYPCEGTGTYLASIEYLDAKEEVLGDLCDVVEEMTGATRHAEKELFIERAERDDD